MEAKQEYEFIKRGAFSLGVSLENKQIELLQRYGDLLAKKNEELNLTRITRADYALLHALDSLSVARAVELKEVNTVLDVGTGAGFPAIPLAIAFPHLSVTAFDARKKKLLWIQDVAQELGLKNIRIAHGRAEQCAESGELGYFDLVCSRALANYSTLLEWQLPFVGRPPKHMRGCAVLLKSAQQRTEIAAKAPTGWEQSIVEITLPSPPIGSKQHSPNADSTIPADQDHSLKRLLVVLTPVR